MVYPLAIWQGQNKAQGARVWDFVALATLVIMALSWSADLPKRLVFSVALLGFLVAGFRGRSFTALLRRPWIAAIGGMCYTIYLIHLPLLEALTPLTNRLVFTNIFGLHLLWQVLLVFPVVFVVSAAGFLWLEKPCMDKAWPEKLWARIRNSSLVLNNTKES